MISRTGLSFLSVYTRHKRRFGVFGQFFNDVYALVILSFGVENVDSLILIDQYSLVTYLSAHLSIEWSEVENELEKRVLFLCNLAVT